MLSGLELRMPKVAPELVDLLQALFQQDELSRALEREDWSVELVKHLSPVEHTTPDAWFHGVVRLVVQRDEVPELLAMARRLRPKRSAEIDALARSSSSTAGATPAKVAASSVKVNPVNTRPAPQGWRPVRVLHLSDLHFSAKTAWDSGTVLGRLAADVGSLRAEVGELHLVVVTGDIANFGTADEYAQATAWLTGPLATAAGVNASKIRVVPGNHDVHRASISRTARMVADGLLRDPDPQQAIAEVLSDPNERAPLLARQSAYLTFAQTFHPGLTAPWWSESLPDLQGLTVHLAGLNSAWLSASDADRGNLVLSRWLCNELLKGAEDADLTIALLHHPWDYLHEHDQASEEEIRRRCGVILNGHLHQQKARIASDPDRDVLQLAAGASYAGSKWANAYQLLELDPMRGEARVHFRLWDGHDWIPDRNRYQRAPDGVATLPLRRSPRAPAPRAMTPAELALSELFSEEFTTPALNAWLSADLRRAPARSALAGEDQEDRLDLLAVTLTQLGLVDEALFVSLIHERPQSAQAVAEVARACGVTLPTLARPLDAEAKPADKLSRYSRLELVVELEELQQRRARARRDQHDLEGLDDEINDVVRRLADVPPPRKGAVVAGATLEARIDSGTFGTVWRGRRS
jgi:predicted MPP superfamily phosphohydrolase